MTLKDTPFSCHLCGKKYIQEKAFIKHRCEKMKRLDELATPVGQAAWRYYQEWMRLQRRRVPDVQAFLTSGYYRSMIRFADHVKRLKLPSPDIFIKMMVENQYLPTLWVHDEVYALYMEHLDRRVAPKDLAFITIDTLDTLADRYECEIDQVFGNVNPSEVIELVRQRKLSPWLLLHSRKFFFFLNQVRIENKTQFNILEQLIRPNYWKPLFKKHPKEVNTMKKIAKELEL